MIEINKHTLRSMLLVQALESTHESAENRHRLRACVESKVNSLLADLSKSQSVELIKAQLDQFSITIGATFDVVDDPGQSDFDQGRIDPNCKVFDTVAIYDTYIGYFYATTVLTQLRSLRIGPRTFSDRQSFNVVIDPTWHKYLRCTFTFEFKGIEKEKE